MNEHIAGNVGVLDEVLRYVLIAAIVVAAGTSLSTLGPDWILLIIIPSGLAIGYLLLSSAAHADFLYETLGIDTRHRKGRPRGR